MEPTHRHARVKIIDYEFYTMKLCNFQVRIRQPPTSGLATVGWKNSHLAGTGSGRGSHLPRAVEGEGRETKQKAPYRRKP